MPTLRTISKPAAIKSMGKNEREGGADHDTLVAYPVSSDLTLRTDHDSSGSTTEEAPAAKNTNDGQEERAGISVTQNVVIPGNAFNSDASSTTSAPKTALLVNNGSASSTPSSGESSNTSLKWNDTNNSTIDHILLQTNNEFMMKNRNGCWEEQEGGHLQNLRNAAFDHHRQHHQSIITNNLRREVNDSRNINIHMPNLSGIEGNNYGDVNMSHLASSSNYHVPFYQQPLLQGQELFMAPFSVAIPHQQNEVFPPHSFYFQLNPLLDSTRQNYFVNTTPQATNPLNSFPSFSVSHHCGNSQMQHNATKFGGNNERDIKPSTQVEAASTAPRPTDLDLLTGEKPRRPLNAYNFFFSEEREVILAEIKFALETSCGQEGEHEAATKKSPGQEEVAKILNSPPVMPEALMKDLKEKVESKTELLLNTRKEIERAKKIPHRKIHGIGFRPLSKAIAARWKKLGLERKEYYRNLAKIDLERYTSNMNEYAERVVLKRKKEKL